MSGNRAKNGKIKELFIRIPWSLLDSPSGQALSGPASKTLLLLYRQKRDFKNDHESVKFPYADAERWNIDRHIFSRTIKELTILGIIEKKSHGGLYRNPNEYKFSDKWRDPKFQGEIRFKIDTKTFNKWMKGEIEKMTIRKKKKTCQQGRGEVNRGPLYDNI